MAMQLNAQLLIDASRLKVEGPRIAIVHLATVVKRTDVSLCAASAFAAQRMITCYPRVPTQSP